MIENRVARTDLLVGAGHNPLSEVHMTTIRDWQANRAMWVRALEKQTGRKLDYWNQLVRETSITDKDDLRTFTFDLGTAVKHNQPAVLQAFYVSQNNANNLTFRFSINGTTVRDINVTGNHFSTIHEVQSNVTKNNQNSLEVRIVGGTGAVRISDIVLFVQRTV